MTSSVKFSRAVSRRPLSAITRGGKKSSYFGWRLIVLAAGIMEYAVFPSYVTLSRLGPESDPRSDIGSELKFNPRSGPTSSPRSGPEMEQGFAPAGIARSWAQVHTHTLIICSPQLLNTSILRLITIHNTDSTGRNEQFPRRQRWLLPIRPWWEHWSSFYPNCIASKLTISDIYQCQIFNSTFRQLAHHQCVNLPVLSERHSTRIIIFINFVNLKFCKLDDSDLKFLAISDSSIGCRRRDR